MNTNQGAALAEQHGPDMTRPVGKRNYRARQSQKVLRDQAAGAQLRADSRRFANKANHMRRVARLLQQTSKIAAKYFKYTVFSLDRTP